MGLAVRAMDLPQRKLVKGDNRGKRLVSYCLLCYKFRQENSKTGNRDRGKLKMRRGLRPILSMALVCASFLGVRNNELTWNQSQAAQSIFQSYTKPLRAPEFSLEDLLGKMINIREYKGQVILLNFWATW